jgi:hypothetical protein
MSAERRMGHVRIIRPENHKVCEACEKLQTFRPGGRCYDCREARDWAKRQVKVEAGEYELRDNPWDRADERGYCTKPGCNERLPIGHRRLCHHCFKDAGDTFHDLGEKTGFALVTGRARQHSGAS